MFPGQLKRKKWDKQICYVHNTASRYTNELTTQAPSQYVAALGNVVHACRGSAKTHHTTDEAALKQLASLHPLPALVLEYRCMQNILNKWVEPDWVKHTAAAHTGANPTHAQHERLHPQQDQEQLHDTWHAMPGYTTWWKRAGTLRAG